MSYSVSHFHSTIFTVSQLTHQIRTSLEVSFPSVWVQGEISNLRCPASGHLYFSLKDQESQIRVVLFRSQAKCLRFRPEDGLDVMVCGRVTVYEPRGEYQLILESLEPKGKGALQLAYEQLKATLAREGLFDENQKRALPFLPKTVGIITSPTGAAIHDILTILQRRSPMVSLLIHPVAVQGDEAAHQITKAIETMNNLGGIDVLIVGRGGGSLEDLWCFNEESVVRAIARSSIPVISAVGHEIDYTLSDFAADYRAPTPSAAAEIVAPQWEDLLTRIGQHKDRLDRAIHHKIDHDRSEVRHHRQALPDPTQWVNRYAQRVDELETRFHVAWHNFLGRLRLHLTDVHSRIRHVGPQHRVQQERIKVTLFQHRLIHGSMTTLTHHRHRTMMQIASLHNLSPLAILSRGYSLVETIPEKRIVRRSRDVQEGDVVRARLAEGTLFCLIQKIQSAS